MAVAVDSDGNAYIAGDTTSSDPIPFPTTENAYQRSLPNPYGSVFVSKIATRESGANALVYSTYLGGTVAILDEYVDYTTAIALDSQRKIYVAGGAGTSDFRQPQVRTKPATEHWAVDSSLRLTRARPDLHHWFIRPFWVEETAGRRGDQINDLAVDAKGDAYVTGLTSSTDFPITSDALQSTLKSSENWDAFVTELNPEGTGILYSTYWGGGCGEWGEGIALDSAGNIYLGGLTCSSEYPVSSQNVYQPSFGGIYDAFVAKFATLVSIALSPQAAIIVPGATQQYTAIGTYSDGSTQDLSSKVTWSVAADPGIASISTSGLLTGTVEGVATVTASLSGISGTATITVSSTLPAPVISSLSPTSGSIGTNVVITGTYFGASQGSSTVTFNGTSGIILSWSSTQIVALVPSQATTGSVVVTVNGVSSNGMTFTVSSGSASQNPLLQLQIDDTPATVNLSAASILDWVVPGGTTPSRKDGSQLISDFSAVNVSSSQADAYGYITYSWSDGTPQTSNTEPAELTTSQLNSGFQITVPADTTVKTLKLYVGVHGRASVVASLSDGSSAAITDSSVSAGGETDKTYSIDFRAASSGQTLTVTVSLIQSGYLTVQAATLQNHLPAVSVTWPQAGQSYAAASDVPFNVNATQFDSSIAGVSIFGDGTEMFNWTTVPYTATWTSVTAGHHQLLAQATDGNGLQNSSKTVEFDATASGGSLSVSLGQFDAYTSIDLTAEGTADWRLFTMGGSNGGGMSSSLFSQDTVTYDPWKEGVASLISPYTQIGNHSLVQLYCCGVEMFTFTDGTPDESGYSVMPAITIDGVGNGAELTVAADTTPRTLKLYAGAAYGRAKLQAFLSDGSAAPVIDTSLDNTDYAQTTVYTINYNAASANQKLTLRFTLDKEYDWGELFLHAATLSGTNPAQLTAISPTSGPVGTKITITGSGFGSSQGAVTIGGTAASVLSWTDTEVQVSVPDGCTTGVVTLQAGSYTVTGPTFTVDQTTYTISPSVVNMLVGESRTLAVTANGVTLSNLAWTTSDSSIVTLSTDDPPVLTALTAGAATFSAGDVSITVTVYEGTSLPAGTPIWSLPLTSSSDSTSQIELVPAIPFSDSSVDMFAVSSGNLFAIGSDGTKVWNQYIGTDTKVIPDFSGGVLLAEAGIQPLVNRKDLSTGETTNLYTSSLGTYTRSLTVIPHPSDVIFVKDGYLVSVVNISTGQVVANVEIEKSISTGCILAGIVPGGGPGNMIVAGDGNAYIPYMYATAWLGNIIHGYIR